jgi:addiction module HigA family antidote
MRLSDMLPPIHPGEMLRELYLEPLEMTAADLARHLRVPPSSIEGITSEKVGITADMALRLGKFFRTTPDLWLNMQTTYDLKIQSAALEAGLAKINEIELIEEPISAPAT